MKSFLVKYLTVLGILAFGFLGGFLYVKKDVAQCQEEYDKLAEVTNECKDKFVQCIMVLMQQKGVKK
jgi:hypothetical protein